MLSNQQTLVALHFYRSSTIGPYPNGIRLEGFPKSEWYYFDKNGVLQEFVGWKALEVKTKDSVGRKYGEKTYKSGR